MASMQVSLQQMIRVNRETRDAGNATVNVLDHGFLFGDSIYEVVRTVKRRPLAWRQHLKRLRNSAARISLELPWTDRELEEEVETIIREAPWSDETYVRIVITRGVGKIELIPTTCAEPMLIVIGKPLLPAPPEFYERGVVLCVTEVRRNSRHAMDPGIKSGNYLNNVLAVIEAQKKGAQDALMLNEHGHLTECTTSNIFLVSHGIVRTPSLDCGILAGITRETLLELMRQVAIPSEETELTLKDLRAADEVFMSGTVKGVVPVSSVIGEVDWRSGPRPLTARIRSLYECHIGLADDSKGGA